MSGYNQKLIAALMALTLGANVSLAQTAPATAEDELIKFSCAPAVFTKNLQKVVASGVTNALKPLGYSRIKVKTTAMPHDIYGGEPFEVYASDLDNIFLSQTNPLKVEAVDYDFTCDAGSDVVLKVSAKDSTGNKVSSETKNETYVDSKGQF